MVNSLLPSAIEAVYMRPCKTMATCHSEDAGVHAAYANLLRQLNRTAQELPLLELNTSNLVEPFRLAAA